MSRKSEAVRTDHDLRLIGWREWMSFPGLGLTDIKAKVDTGARTSALHAYDIHVIEEGGRRLVRFKVHPLQRNTKIVVAAQAELLEHRYIRSSSGKQTLRPVIKVAAKLGSEIWPIELTLINRDAMGFRLLLGREALRGRFLVDPGRSYIQGHKKASSRG